MNLADLRQVEIFSLEVKPETVRVGRVGRSAGNLGVTVREMNIAERRLVAEDAQVGVELLDRFTIGRGVSRVNVGNGSAANVGVSVAIFCVEKLDRT